MTWRVVLSGSRTVLQELAGSVVHPEWRVEEDEGDFVLRSAEMREDQSHREVQRMVQAVVQRINGALAASDTGHRALKADIQRVGADGKRTLFEAAVVKVRSSLNATITVEHADGTTEKESLGDFLWGQVEPGEADPDVDRVLCLLTKGDDWVNLYRIYEIIRKDAGVPKEIAARGWARKKDLALFGQTAQEARHGVPKGSPPPCPMTPKRARSLIHGLCRQWFASKVP